MLYFSVADVGPGQVQLGICQYRIYEWQKKEIMLPGFQCKFMQFSDVLYRRVMPKKKKLLIGIVYNFLRKILCIAD